MLPSLSPGSESEPLRTTTNTPATSFKPPYQASQKHTIKNICCVGAGYVGGPTAGVIALHNPHIRVTVVDKDAARVRKWNSKHLPVKEPGLYDVVHAARDGKRERAGLAGHDTVTLYGPNLYFSTDVAKNISEADAILLSVNTPTKASGIGAGMATDMGALEVAARDIASAAKPGAIIVEKSTVPCGTAQMIRNLLDACRPGVPFEILSNPEFLAEGTAIDNLLKPDRVLIGSARTCAGLAAAASLKEVYSAWVDPAKIITVNLWSSELSKLAANAMLAQRLSSINSISAICERTGADIEEVAKVIGLDQRLGPKFLKAGLGFGGSCFKKDILSLVYLAQSLELPEVGDYWLQVLKMNEYQRNRFVERIVKSLNVNLTGKKIAVLGYAFKKNTSDTRESPAANVIRSLLERFPAELAIFDPRCHPEDIKDEIRVHCTAPAASPLRPDGPVEVYRHAHQACANASAVLILTEWDQFRFPQCPAPESPAPVRARPPSVSLLKYRISEQQLLACCKFDTETTVGDTDVDDDQNPGMKPISSTEPSSPAGAELPCPEDCRDCRRGPAEEAIAAENLDWRIVAESMREPKWVFDGRGVVDVRGMEELGFRVETIGKPSTRSGIAGL